MSGKLDIILGLKLSPRSDYKVKVVRWNDAHDGVCAIDKTIRVGTYAFALCDGNMIACSGINDVYSVDEHCRKHIIKAAFLFKLIDKKERDLLLAIDQITADRRPRQQDLCTYHYLVSRYGESLSVIRKIARRGGKIETIPFSVHDPTKQKPFISKVKKIDDIRIASFVKIKQGVDLGEGIKINGSMMYLYEGKYIVTLGSPSTYHYSELPSEHLGYSGRNILKAALNFDLIDDEDQTQYHWECVRTDKKRREANDARDLRDLINRYGSSLSALKNAGFWRITSKDVARAKLLVCQKDISKLVKMKG